MSTEHLRPSTRRVLERSLGGNLWSAMQRADDTFQAPEMVWIVDGHIHAYHWNPATESLEPCEPHPERTPTNGQETRKAHAEAR